MSADNKPDYLASYAPELFPWYRNRVQASLEKLAYHEPHEPDKVIEIMHQIENSSHFWALFAAYGDHHDAAKGDLPRQNRAMWALLARFYVAGTLDGRSVVGDAEFPHPSAKKSDER